LAAEKAISAHAASVGRSPGDTQRTDLGDDQMHKNLTAVFVLAFVLGGVGFASANDLKLYINNETSTEFYYSAAQNVKDYPTHIDAKSESSEIETDRNSGKGSVGQITYMNNQNQADATCSVTLEFSYIINSVTGKCDDKNFTYVNKNGCSLAQDRCDGDNDCSCHFNLTSSN
jgi:hypothetical protein